MADQSAPLHDHELNEYWNELVRDVTQIPREHEGFDETTIAAVAWFHRLGSAAAPATSRERVRRQLQWRIDENQTTTTALNWHGLAPLPLPSLPASPNGHAPQVANARPGSNRAHRSIGRAIARAAIAALALLVLMGAFVALRPGLPGPRFAHPVLLPAINSAPGSPPPTAAPVAAFLWSSGGSPDMPFGLPSQPAVDAQGTLWVPDSRHDRFLLFAPDGTFLEAWGTSGSDAGQFRLGDPYSPTIATGAVAFDEAGNIFVADTGNKRIQKFGPDRQFITSWGSEGSGTGQFRRPIALAVDGRGWVYVADEAWGKIEVFDDEGTWLTSWTALGAPEGITVSGDGTIWVAEASVGVVQFTPEGERLATWDAYATGIPAGPDPVSVAVDAEGRVFVADWGPNQILAFSSDGTLLGAWGESGDAFGQIPGIRGIVLDGQGNVYVTDSTEKRVQKFQLLSPLASEAVPAG